MSIKTTKKGIMSTYAIVVAVPYCKLSYLLEDMQPLAHTERVEGWGADVYPVTHGAVIVTGYKPFGNYAASADICNKYNERARQLIEGAYNYIDAYMQLPTLRKAFLQEVLQDEQQD